MVLARKENLMLVVENMLYLLGKQTRPLGHSYFRIYCAYTAIILEEILYATSKRRLVSWCHSCLSVSLFLENYTLFSFTQNWSLNWFSVSFSLCFYSVFVKWFVIVCLVC